MIRLALAIAMTLAALPRTGAAQEVDRLIQDLGNPDPETRERSLQSLRAAGRRAQPALERALKGAREVELRGPLESLLLPFKIDAVREIVGGGAGGTVVLASSDGKARLVLGGRPRGTLAHRFSWSPDGRRIAYAVGHDRYGLSDLYLLDLGTALETKVAAGIPGPFRPVWSRDSQKVAFAVMRKDKDLDFCAFSVGTGSVERPKCRNRKMWNWSSDGAHIVERWFGFVGSDGPGAHSAYGQGFSDTPVDPAFLELVRISGPIVTSADEQRVFYFGTLGNGFTFGCSTNWTKQPLRMLDRTSRETVTLASEVPGKEFEFFRNSLSVSPDGKSVAFLRCTPQGEEVSVVDLDTWKERRLGEGRSPAWSYDGTRLAYERKEGGTRIVDLKTGKEVLLEGVGSPSFAPPFARQDIESRDRSKR